MRPPVRFITFGISHYCEKARWALDWHHIPYEEECWPPGPHILLAKRVGARKSALPILLLPDGMIQGSGAVIDWAEQETRTPDRPLTIPGTEEIEERADKVLGVHVRRLAYAHCLPKHPHVVKPALFHNVAGASRLIGNLMWPLTRRLMIKGFKITPEAPAQSRDIIETEIDWLDGLLADGRPFLLGDRFSRADVTVASLLSPFVRPPHLPLYTEMNLPKPLEDNLQEWNERPVMKWATQLYNTHRGFKIEAA